MGPTTLLTADDLLAPAYGDLPHELWRGGLRSVMPASYGHGSVVSRLTVGVGQHVYAHDLGEIFSADTGFQLERDPDTVLCPDLAFVRKGRLPAGGLGWRFAEVAPDLAVEVLSPNDRAAEVREKVGAYLRLGVSAVWVIDPVERTVRIYIREGRDVLLGERDDLDGGEVLPGFRYPAAALFAALRP
jgi:Uma2 family endonuclease